MRRVNLWIDRLGFSSIALVCLGYVVFASSFAELCLTFSFLNFPVFIGEILLFYCLVLFIYKLCRRELSFRREHWVFVVYACFVLIKTFDGYVSWGPLAFRDAALFYYPFFAILGYSFWEPDSWGVVARRVTYLMLIVLLATQEFHYFWPVSLIILAVLLAWRERGAVRVFCIAGIVLFAPYASFFPKVRTVVLASSVTLVFIVSGFVSSIRVNKQIRLLFAVLGLLAASVVVLRMTDPQIWHALNAKIILQGAKPPADQISEMPRQQEIHLFNPDGIVSANKKDTWNYFLTDVTAKMVKMKKSLRLPAWLSFMISPKTAMRDEPSIATGAQGEVFLQPQEGAYFSLKRDDTLFRFYIWRDMIIEYWKNKPVFGFDFGRPLRSPTMRYYGISTSENEDGWLGAHNSYLNVIYRGGVIGLVVVISFVVFWFQATKISFACKNWEGILLCAILVNWMVSASFFLVWELPYLAIPMWTLFGITAKQCVLLKKNPIGPKYAKRPPSEKPSLTGAAR